VTSIWTERLSETHSQLHILTGSSYSEKVTGNLSAALEDTLEDIRIVCLPVEASIPAEETGSGLISHDELKQDITDMTNPVPSTWVLTFLSAVVAAAGLYRNSATVTHSGSLVQSYQSGQKAFSALIQGDGASQPDRFHLLCFGRVFSEGGSAPVGDNRENGCRTF